MGMSKLHSSLFLKCSIRVSVRQWKLERSISTLMFRLSESMSVSLCGYESCVSDVSFVFPLGQILSQILRVTELSFLALSLFFVHFSPHEIPEETTPLCVNIPVLTETCPILQQSPIGADWTHLTSPGPPGVQCGTMLLKMKRLHHSFICLSVTQGMSVPRPWILF